MSRKPDWSRLAPLLGVSSPTASSPELPSFADDLLYSDFSETIDVVQLQAVIAGLQQIGETLLTSKRRAADAAGRLSRANEELAVENRHLNELALVSTHHKHQTEVYRCDDCGKKFRTPGYLDQHRERRHKGESALAVPSLAAENLNHLLSEQGERIDRTLRELVPAVREETRGFETGLGKMRDFLASEIQAAVKRALDLHALVPPGVSWTGDLDLSSSFLTPSP